MINLINSIKTAQVQAMVELSPFKTKNETMYNTVKERMESAIIDLSTIDKRTFELLNVKTAKEMLSVYYTALNRKYTASNNIDKVIWSSLVKHL